MRLRGETGSIFLQTVGSAVLKCYVASASGLTIQRTYTPYAFVDVSVPDESSAILFDVLTRELQQLGKIDANDPMTLMAISAGGIGNPDRLAIRYELRDESKVALDIMHSSLPKNQSNSYDPAKSYVPPQGQTLYDPMKTYVTLDLGYRLDGVPQGVVSDKILALIKLASVKCRVVKIECSVRARLQ